MSGTRRFPYLAVEPPVAFAHRGGTGVHPENTMAAFRHAVALGYTHLETDVHATADGVAVAFHDPDLDRVTDRRGRISEMTWAEVATARVASAEPIPRLDELLTELPDVCFNLDPKSDRAVAPMVEVIRRTGSIDRVCVTSFSGRRTRRVVRALGVSLCHGSGPLGVASLVARGFGIPVPGRIAPVAQVPARWGPVPIVTRRFVRAAHRAGVAVHVWTVNDSDEMERLLALGVDGLMTDDTELLLQALGIWRADRGGPVADDR